jgi:hypothetical protein
MAKRQRLSLRELHALVQAALDGADRAFRSSRGQQAKRVHEARAGAYATVLCAMEGNPEAIAYLQSLREGKGASDA